jgi:mRNA-degrading endonuclease YafQ of YafQ-DinJ toxin-antitoxin module
MLFTELQQESLRTLRKENDYYNDLRAAHAEASNEIEGIINTLPHKDMKLAEKFRDYALQLDGIEQDYLYLQGYRDCVKFLKLIQAI